MGGDGRSLDDVLDYVLGFIVFLALLFILGTLSARLADIITEVTG